MLRVDTFSHIRQVCAQGFLKLRKCFWKSFNSILSFQESWDTGSMNISKEAFFLFYLHLRWLIINFSELLTSSRWPKSHCQRLSYKVGDSVTSCWNIHHLLVSFHVVPYGLTVPFVWSSFPSGLTKRFFLPCPASHSVLHKLQGAAKNLNRERYNHSFLLTVTKLLQWNN